MFTLPESENFCLEIRKNSSSSDENYTSVATEHYYFVQNSSPLVLLFSQMKTISPHFFKNQ